MSDPTPIETIDYRVETLDYAVAGRDFDAHTHHYEATLYGTLHLSVDGEEIEQRPEVPGKVDLLETARIQHELVERIERGDPFEDAPFCCSCGVRGCLVFQWTVDAFWADRLRLRMRGIQNEPVADSPYAITREALYGNVADLFETILEYCDRVGAERFGWAEWMEPSANRRDHYATRAEIQAWLDAVAAI